MDDIIIAIVVALVALLVGFPAWKRFTVSGNIYTLIKSSDTLERYPEGESKRAYDRLVKMGPRALQALQARNARLIAEHQAYSESLKVGPSWNPYENYGQKSDAEKRYRYVIEIRQARIVDVITEIETAVRGGAG